ncbi:hypothetical protein [Trichormus azollae]|jgi:hypothetical protein|uniref:hypothetical protein n=1 Tax=Trichormus azollae TaxID=1164 RepID=UPI0001957536|nr:hypothetical protein [Trichormus azollae]
MKCINCGTDNTLKDRTANQGRYKQYNYPFTSEPKIMGNFKIKDPICAKSISDLHAKNTLFFTPKQLLYSLDIRLKSRVPSSIYIFIIAYIFFNVFFTVICGLVSLSKLIISVLTSFLRINLPENIRFILPILTFPLVG